jgi:hypothetical protein
LRKLSLSALFEGGLKTYLDLRSSLLSMFKS